ncbi:caspase family protein [Nitrospira sp. Kam-Ns4a]
MLIKKALATCLTVLGLIMAFWAEGRAESRRALLVGINKYGSSGTPQLQFGTFGGAGAKESGFSKATRISRGSWTDLDGAVNDARAMREILIQRNGFPPENILLLENEAATRERILGAFQSHLIEPAKPGDRLVFFYAGHGSRIRNSRSGEADGRDETIVPADFKTGVMDIRDKELARLYTQALNKGVVLTAIFDSCHSGSLSRGPTPVLEKSRVGPEDERDVAELIGPEPPPFTEAEGPPEKRPGALFVSAAQEDESALEAMDEHKIRHGAFTLALLRTLATVSPHAPAKQIFSRVSALLKADHKLQQPVLEGTEARRAQALFGGDAEAGGGRLVVSVIKKLDEQKVELQAGWAVGLTAGSELRKLGAPPAKPVRVRVTRVTDVGRSEAELVGGAGGEIRPGDSFELEKWGVESPGLLRLWLAPALDDLAGLTRVARELSGLRGSPRVTWVEDPWKQSPTHVLFWSGTEWMLSSSGGERKGLGKSPTAALVLERLRPGDGKKAELFLNLPPWLALAAALDPSGDPAAGAVQMAAAPEEADYLLVGHSRDGRVEYAWSLKNVTETDVPRQFPMPIRTDWVAPDQGAAGEPAAQLAAELKRQTARLSRLQGWLTLKGSAEDERFPYHLALRHARTGRIVGQEDLQGEEVYGLVLQAEPDRLREALRGRGVERRYVYVFVIDTHGQSTLLFPEKGAGNVGNRVPFDVKVPGEEIPLGPGELLQITEPFGTDTYILLATKEALPDPDVLDAEGVRTRGGARGPDNELGRLIESIGTTTRGGKPLAAPSAWSIQRVTLRSVARGQ